MAHPYSLAQTYAPSVDLEMCMAQLAIDPPEFCHLVGIHPSTYERMLRYHTVSRRTAERIAYGFALLHGGISPRAAFTRLFVPRPQVIMEPDDEGNKYRRRRDS
jgi:hypothetical protein